MVDDEPGGGKRRSSAPPRGSRGGQGGGSGMGGLGNIIGYLLPMLIRKPKLLIILAIIGIGIYFFMGRGCSSVAPQQNNSEFSRGGELNKDVYEQTEIFEALADNRKNPLPERVSLQKYCPTPLNQGQQGSCVAWASAYTARTILEAQRTGKSPNSVRFSPSYLFNEIKLNRDCQGSYIKYAMDKMYADGAAPYESFPYDDDNCSRTPSGNVQAEAEKYKIRGFQRLTEENRQNSKAYEILAIKQNLAQGSPVVIGMAVGGSFMQAMKGQDIWFPTQADYSMRGFGGHAMCIIGYDDFKEGGSFQLQNSWGTDWGNKGFFWIRYTDFKYFNSESYGLYPMGNADKRDLATFSGNFALVLSQNGQEIPLKLVNGNYYETVSNVPKNTKFKVEFTNNTECYTYIFGSETNQSCYVLFPYTKLHSPFCGITGTRLFPSDKSMIADNEGTKDKFAVIVSSEPIDYVVMNDKINAASGSTFEQKIENVLSGQVSRDVKFSGSKSVQFTKTNDTKDFVYFVIGVNK